ncbi:UvrD-helicase domain-containing protein [Nisaea acidiphila]|uniref:DNA 3'-5' helicase n=1 Tax=Nisaea acidiphila TaxID=1862145 RepID=A0A9J7AN58_9PROT|nr:UvrD-helicase domain-containing protein [Nisaea acidiphila]UUX49075.1 UvrD-helicase domain-containing protein [Nisaea acidiphila]
MTDLFFESEPEKPANGGGDNQPYFDGLNERQGEAVRTLDGPLLVLAGAGTGKTRVLTTRLAHLISTGTARPWNVLAVTFTNKAAREMRERVAAVIGPMAEQVWLGTFHALGARILRRHAELVDLRPDFTILDTDDQQRLLKQILQAENIDDKKWPARAMMGVIQRWKDRGLTPDKVGRGDAGDLAGGRLVEIYRQYQERLKILNAVDFGDLLLLTVNLFQSHPDVLTKYHDQFTHILVDEYQDTNVVQYLWLRLLAQKSRNICCVGDDDQSIYGWRGAEVGNILKFEKDFPGAQIIRLEQNYRSTSRILAAASGLIAHNEGRLGKTLWTDGADGEKLEIRGLWDGESEARHVGDEIESLQRKGAKLSEIAVLVRAGFQTREFEERFLTIGLPYRVVGGARFYERMETRDALAYLRVVNQRDDDLAFERIVNKPKRGIGDATMQSVHYLARNEGISLYRAAARIVETDELKPAAKRKLAEVVENFERWRSLVEVEDHSDLARIILDESGYTEMWQRDKSPEAPGRLENLKELCGAMEEFENLAGFLEHISLVMENAESADQEQVSIMTLHAAKGLEFNDVFLPGWEDGMFPNQRALDESGAAGLEEERRLAYVGLTRARKAVHISFAANRRVHGMWQSAVPSRFIEELPDEHIELSSETGFQGSRYGGFGAQSGDADLWGDGGFGYGSAQSGRGPGYGRRRGESRAGPPLLEGKGYVVDRSSPPGFEVGERVFHQKFGMGTVSSVDGDKLQIAFDKAGSKKLVASFVSKP